MFSLKAYNQSDRVIRSVYLQAVAYDDTGDELTSSQCVYQGVNVGPGDALPKTKTFGLGTELAYRVELFCEKIAFEDGEVWRYSEDAKEYALAEPSVINAQNFPRYKYLAEEYEKLWKPRFPVPQAEDREQQRINERN